MSRQPQRPNPTEYSEGLPFDEVVGAVLLGLCVILVAAIAVLAFALGRATA